MDEGTVELTNEWLQQYNECMYDKAFLLSVQRSSTASQQPFDSGSLRQCITGYATIYIYKYV